MIIKAMNIPSCGLLAVLALSVVSPQSLDEQERMELDRAWEDAPITFGAQDDATPHGGRSR